jgi:hypothetical protein
VPFENSGTSLRRIKHLTKAEATPAFRAAGGF